MNVAWPPTCSLVQGVQELCFTCLFGLKQQKRDKYFVVLLLSTMYVAQQSRRDEMVAHVVLHVMVSASSQSWGDAVRKRSKNAGVLDV